MRACVRGRNSFRLELPTGASNVPAKQLQTHVSPWYSSRRQSSTEKVCWPDIKSIFRQSGIAVWTSPGDLLCADMYRVDSDPDQRRLQRRHEWVWLYLPPNQLLIPLFAFAAFSSTVLSNLSTAPLRSLPAFWLSSLAFASASASLDFASTEA